MQSLRRILIGLEPAEDFRTFTTTSRDALRQGLQLATMNSGEVTQMTVLDARLKDADDAGLTSVEEQVRGLHEQAAAEATELGVRTHSVIAFGRCWQELIRQVLRDGSDLLVIGTRDPSLARRALFGSTALKLFRKCPCPVWATRPGSFQKEISHIVAADDFGDVGERVLHLAVQTAQLMNSRLLVVHSVGFPFKGGVRRAEVSEEHRETAREEVIAEAERRLLDRLSMTDYRTLQSGTKILVAHASAEAAIQQAVIETEADLLVMGTVGRAGIPGLLIGNTAERLLTELQCSVLAIKPEGFVSPVTLE